MCIHTHIYMKIHIIKDYKKYKNVISSRASKELFPTNSLFLQDERNEVLIPLSGPARDALHYSGVPCTRDQISLSTRTGRES